MLSFEILTSALWSLIFTDRVTRSVQGNRKLFVRPELERALYKGNTFVFPRTDRFAGYSILSLCWLELGWCFASDARWSRSAGVWQMTHRIDSWFGTTFLHDNIFIISLGSLVSKHSGSLLVHLNSWNKSFSWWPELSFSPAKKMRQGRFFQLRTLLYTISQYRNTAPSLNWRLSEIHQSSINSKFNSYDGRESFQLSVQGNPNRYLEKMWATQMTKYMVFNQHQSSL